MTVTLGTWASGPDVPDHSVPPALARGFFSLAVCRQTATTFGPKSRPARSIRSVMAVGDGVNVPRVNITFGNLTTPVRYIRYFCPE